MQKNENLQPIGIEEIKTKIYEVRGMKVMLDKDLAKMYGTTTKNLKRQVKRNISRFPSDFMLELNNDEYNLLRSQIGTLKQGEHSKYPPYAFTEYGIAMLSSVLTSEIAAQVNITIMRAFIVMKQNILEIQQRKQEINETNIKIEKIYSYIEEILHDQNDINEDTATQLELINQTLAELQNEKSLREKALTRTPIGFRIEK